jgi:hypothetical protein
MHTMKAHGGVDAYLHLFLIMALDGSEWSASCPFCFNHDGKTPGRQSQSGHFGEEERFCSKLNIQMGSRAHPSSHSMNNEGSHRG